VHLVVRVALFSHVSPHQVKVIMAEAVRLLVHYWELSLYRHLQRLATKILDKEALFLDDELLLDLGLLRRQRLQKFEDSFHLKLRIQKTNIMNWRCCKSLDLISN
jgi:hypothetical protein